MSPARGEIWWYDPDPVRGHEQGYPRPALVVSASTFNRGPQGLIMILPLTRTVRQYPFRVELTPEESGLQSTSYIMCEQLRTISTERLLDSRPVGRASATVMSQIEHHLRTILELHVY